MFASLSLGLALLPFALGAVHDVQVGGKGGELVFQPEAIFAAAGDQVVFHFNPKNHTVTQSSFADPCGLKEGGFNSGFQPVAANQTTLPTYTVSVNNTDPIWVYCAQAARTANSHCGKGMVFAINCGSDDKPNSFTNFKKSALAVGAALATEAPAATTTAAYGGLTIAAAPTPTLVTSVITLQSSTWTTTYSSYPNSPAPTPATLDGAVHKVIVGGPGKLAFDPPRLTALPRDVIVFEFHQKNHTVTQSSFEDPCRPLTADGQKGFDSGFIPVADSLTEFPTWNYTVKDTAPVWAYCAQLAGSSHCGAGMVFAINSDESSGRSFNAFQGVAKTLNGTAASSTAPADTKGTGNGAVSTRSGFALGVTAFFALVASLL
ncbi:hypothetical protein DFP72DRAFT_866191 [Ephemerocybe angulata]|uniref:Cupredoxin n=1 Tax=Ephemerocybe angulata TaxID=980116 RepID=A0A8H6MGV9_9AGAR|nr:hypothetical protein DFP72DRAFT_866191 [Tulosesus angulatus]